MAKRTHNNNFRATQQKIAIEKFKIEKIINFSSLLIIFTLLKF